MTTQQQYTVRLPQVQRITLVGEDFALVPGETLQLPECEYVASLVAQGYLVPVPAATANKPKPKEQN